MLKRLAQDLSRSELTATLAAGLIRLLCLTVRWEMVEDSGLKKVVGQEKRPLIFAFWHNRIFGATACWVKFRRVPTCTVLISRSRDGELISRIMHALGLRTERGSSSKGGGQVLRGLLRAIREDHSDISITPDGPRGPKYVVQPGVIRLAQLSGAPIVAWTVVYEKKWELKSWDRFQIPHPFTRAKIWFQAPLEIPRELAEEDFDQYCRRLEGLLGGD